MLQFDTTEVVEFWSHACAEMGLAADNAVVHAGTFAEPTRPERAAFIDQLADMARDGFKRGTAHMQVQFQLENIKLRQPGDYWIVTTTQGCPRCVVRLTDVDVRAFHDVTEAFAASEGEGDLSLAHWREVHGIYFKRQCERWGRTWTEEEPIVCESFEPVYPVPR